MEKTSSAKSNGTFKENGNGTSQWATDTISETMNNYRKQYDMTLRMCNHYLSSFVSEGLNLLDSSGKLASSFLTGHVGAGNSFSPLSGFSSYEGVSEIFLRSAGQFFSNVSEYNRNLLESAGLQIEKNSREWTLLADKYQRNAEACSGVSRNMIAILAGAGNKQIDLGLEMNRQVADEAGKFVDYVMKDNEAFWNEAANIPGKEGDEGSPENDRGAAKKTPKKETQPA